MTTKRTKPVEEELDSPLAKWGLGAKTFRGAILVLVLSMHPIGRSILGTFGFEFPDQRKLTVATEQADSVKTEIQAIGKDLNEIKIDVASLKTNNATLNVKVDNLKTDFTGFQVDFAKYRMVPPATETKTK